MTLVATEQRFLLSQSVVSPAAPATGTHGTNPALALGGRPPPNTNPQNSEFYRQETMNAVMPNVRTIVDTEINVAPPSTTDPEVGDYGCILTGVNAGHRFIVRSVDYVGNSMTISPAVPTVSANGTTFRTGKPHALFDRVTETQARDGHTDYRMVWFMRNETGIINNFKCYVEDEVSLGCTMEMIVSGSTVVQSSYGADVNPSETTNPTSTPFEEMSATGASTWSGHSPFNAWNRGVQAPMAGVSMNNDDFVGVWIRRIVPPNARPGRAVFWIVGAVADATTQEPTADPADFLSAAPIVFDIDPPTGLKLSVSVDRQPYVNGQVRVVGRALYSNNTPVVGWPARLVLATTPSPLGEIVQPALNRTDADGRIIATYICPAAPGSETFRLEVL